MGTPDYEWREDKPNSDKNTRVLGVIMANEGEDVLQKALLWLQKQQEAFKDDGISVVFDNEEYIFLPQYIDRNDKKMDRLLTGISDGCDSCLTPRYLWTDIETINEGFPKDRTFENIRETWASLEKDKNGQVIKRRGDYERRRGICHEPVTLRETYSFTLTHKVQISLS